MARADISGHVAVVASSRAGARSASRALALRLPRATLHPLSQREYLAADPLLPLILAATERGRAERRRFFEEARSRLLWAAPAADLYAAIEGVITSLPRRRQRSPSPARGDLATALLLEGEVGADRAEAALASPVRHWIVEHPGRVKLSKRELARLREHGVVWSALEPVRLLGIALAGRGSDPFRSPAFRGAPFGKATVWRIKPAASRAPSGRPSRK
ncbi:MAG TPA: hypothetical protein VE007_12895 [Thermoanaerobaculia bacterium]|nr:hypothetical protein [Thermoanaerobaculia bacterium]